MLSERGDKAEAHLPVPPPLSHRSENQSVPAGEQFLSTESKATLSTVIDGEIGIVHFDEDKGEIFISGHHLEWVQIGDMEKKLLDRFSELLREARPRLFRSFEEVSKR